MRSPKLNKLFGFLVRSMLTAEAAVLAELQFLRSGFLVLRGGIVALFALGATKGDDVSSHVFVLLKLISAAN
jgi:hypothetical protein